MYVCLHAHMSTCTICTQELLEAGKGHQIRSPRTEQQMVVRHQMLSTKSGSWARTANAFNRRAIFPTLVLFLSQVEIVFVNGLSPPRADLGLVEAG